LQRVQWGTLSKHPFLLLPAMNSISTTRGWHNCIYLVSSLKFMARIGTSFLILL
jgi:hypothetical protein